MIHVNEFADPYERIEWGAADTEAYLLIDGTRLSAEEVDAMGRQTPRIVVAHSCNGQRVGVAVFGRLPSVLVRRF